MIERATPERLDSEDEDEEEVQTRPATHCNKYLRNVKEQIDKAADYDPYS